MLEEYPEPKRRRVEENKRDGKRRDVEYFCARISDDTGMRDGSGTYEFVPIDNRFLHPRDETHGHEFSGEASQLLYVLVTQKKRIRIFSKSIILF